ncbi:MAG: four helix bundle protein [Gemmatimonadetes bacterium]|nr:MAG: four helix bundle protein [Gemmatimonadota bacterium]PYO70380.1 MAG: four helix bundle protein [Gemmatimonadota bacterium]PYO86343.1 MAG: four helix bundle protein [Gemmatimonadota bacterium]PYP62259.1 MAG: four helix bundle protein [Gemmatimonadota bacterium]
MLRANASRLLVYRVASDLSTEAVRLAKSFRGPGAFQRGDQLVRAALSVASNIAEACGRGTRTEFSRFLDYAAGSAAELRAQLRVARTLDPGRAGRIRALENRATLALKMLRRLSQHPPPLST